MPAAFRARPGLQVRHWRRFPLPAANHRLVPWRGAAAPGGAIVKLGLINSAWAQAGRVRQEEIAVQNYILYSKQSITFRLIEKFFRREEIVLNTVIEAGSMEATKELVKLGLGISILSTSKGLLKDQDARRQKVGGEILANVW